MFFQKLTPEETPTCRAAPDDIELADGDTSTHPKGRRRTSSRESGQSMVEFALSLLVLIFILSGLADFGRAYYAYVALEDSAGEAVTFLAIYRGCGTLSTKCPTDNNAMDRAANASNFQGCIDTDADGEPNMDMTVTLADDVDQIPLTAASQFEALGQGDVIRVTLECRISLITPIVSGIVGDSGITLTASASQVIISEKQFTFIP